MSSTTTQAISLRVCGKQYSFHLQTRELRSASRIDGEAGKKAVREMLQQLDLSEEHANRLSQQDLTIIMGLHGFQLRHAAQIIYFTMHEEVVHRVEPPVQQHAQTASLPSIRRRPPRWIRRLWNWWKRFKIESVRRFRIFRE